MQWATALSSEQNVTAALTELKRHLGQQLGQRSPDLLITFLTSHYMDGLGKVPELIRDHFAPRTSIGCTASGVVGGGHEVEQKPGIAMVAAALPDVDIHSFHLNAGDLPDLDSAPDNWVELMGVSPATTPHFLLLVDPAGSGGAAFDPRPLLMGLDFAYAHSAKTGGLTSALEGNVLFLDETLYNSGCVGLALSGNIAVDTIVAQGCRPIGEPLAVTACSGYYLTELDDRPAVEVFLELFHSLTGEDQELCKRALHIGIASTELKAELEHGDYLIRDVMKLDHKSNIIAVSDMLRPGQTVQFHLRDGASAARDLDVMLEQYDMTHPPTDSAVAGALLFTCVGRGEGLFGMPNHDSTRFISRMGDIPMGGFFCGGEFGQVGASTYLHGYTSAFALFKPA